MTDSDWWATVKTKPKSASQPPRPSGRVLTLHHGQHIASLDLRLVENLGAELVLSVNGQLRRARFYRRQQVLELLDAIADTDEKLRAKGWVA